MHAGLLRADLLKKSYFIKLRTMFAFVQIPPATLSNGKQNPSFKTKLIGNNAKQS